LVQVHRQFGLIQTGGFCFLKAFELAENYLSEMRNKCWEKSDPSID